MPLNFDTLQNSGKVQKFLEDHWTNQFTTRRELLAAMRRNEGIVAGGPMVLAGVFTGTNPTVVGVSNPFTHAPSYTSYDKGKAPHSIWSHYYGEALLSAEEMMIDSSDPNVGLDLMEGRLTQTIASFEELIASDLVTGNADAAKNKMSGMAHALKTSTPGVFCGIDRAVDTWYLAIAGGASNGAFTLSKLNTHYRACSGHGKLIINMHTDIYGAYEGQVQAQQRFMTDGKMADLGFTTYLHKGALVVTDENQPSGTVDIINNDHIKVVFMTAEPAQTPLENKGTAKGYALNWFAMLFASRLNKSLRSTGWTAS